MPLPRPAAVLSPRVIDGCLVAATATWLLLLVAAPYVASHADPGSAIFNAGGLVYLAGRIICHQRADRSFHAWGVQLPVCARCMGLYAGALLGALFAAWRSRPESGRQVAPAEAGAGGLTEWRRRLAVAALPTAASVGLEMGRIWAQSPPVRGAAAVPLGCAVAWFVGAHAADLLPSRRNWQRP